MRKLLFVLLLLFAFCSAVYAQKISGYVQDNKNNPIPFATLMLNNNGKIVGVAADTNGYFSMKLPNFETTTLVVRCIGYEEFYYTFKPSEKDKKHTIRLNINPNMLNTVVVTGTRTDKMLKDSPVLTKVIPSSEIYNIGSETVLNALENLVPGLFFNQNAMGDNIQMQGLNNKYILILLDGERLVGERTENVNFSRLNSADIKQIEIINGASSVLYGSNAVGAVINIITKDVDKPVEGYVQGRYASFNTYSIDAGVGFKYKNFSSKTSFNRKSSDGYVLKSDSINPITKIPAKIITVSPGSDFTISQVLKYKFNKKLDIGLNGMYYSGDVAKDDYQTRLGKNYTLGGKINYLFSEKNALTFSGNTDIFKGYTRFPKRNDSTSFENDSYLTTFRLLDAWTPTDKIQVVSGVEYNLESTYSAKQFGENDPEQNAYGWNIFSQGEFKFLKNFDGIIGARLVNNSQFGAHLAPKASLMYSLNDFRFRANVSNGYKAPSLKELYMNYPHTIDIFTPFYIVGNPDLIPENAWYESISAEYTVEKMSFSATVYNNNIANKINTVSRYNAVLDREELHYENVANAQIYGVDLMVQLNFLTYFYANAGYVYANAVDKSNNTQLVGNSKHNGIMGLTYKRANFRIPFTILTVNYPFNITLSGRLASPRTTETLEIINGKDEIIIRGTKAVNIWKLVYSQKIPIYNTLSLDLQFGIDNLFDWTDILGNSINPGRTYFGTLKFNF